MDALRAAYPGRIPLHLSNGVAYLWEPEGTLFCAHKDLKQARTQHNLCGLLSGTLPLIPQQNVFLGLPLRLLPEEVAYLLRHGVYAYLRLTHRCCVVNQRGRSLCCTY